MDATGLVGWLSRRSRAILAASALLVAGATYLVVFHLPLRADLSYLLPADAPSVRAAEQLAGRVPARDRMLVLIAAPDATTRAIAARRMLDGLRAIGPELVDRIESDDRDARELIRGRRHLYIPLAELTAVRDALARELAEAKLRANPLFVDLDDRAATADASQLDELRARQRAAEQRLALDPFVSADGRMQVIVIHTAFRATDVERDRALLGRLDAIARDARGTHPSIAIGFAGGPPVTIAEHAALSRGIAVSSLITLALVSLVLLAHLRSARMLLLLGGNIVAATVVTFGIAAITVGHLNSATAFLGAIIAGNGVNYGILLIARYLEERRRLGVEPALAAAIAGTVLPTLVASLGAAIAYGALAATQFRGFADFAIIGGAGMLVCWIASFVLLPVLVMRFAREVTREPSPHAGRLVARVFAVRRPAIACAVAGAATLVAGAITWRYLTSDPYEYDLTQLRSRAPDAVAAREWLARSDETFGRGLAGVAGQTYVAVERVEQIPGIVAELRARAEREPMLGEVVSILDVIPHDQHARIALLHEIRAQIDQAADALPDDARGELLALRPPDDLAPITMRDLPPALAARLTERDGRIGHLIAVKPGRAFDERDGRDLIRFATAVRELPGSGDDVVVAGAALLFADVLVQIQRDGPLVTALAALGLIVMVIVIVGRTRRAVAVLIATTAGSVAMIAACALAGLRINFLDFVALPITLGLGIDYAINIADRATRSDPGVALRSTGGAVLVCSLTTVIGYLSLLASDNLAIRGFGIASLIGELTCMAAAFVIVPAVIALPALAARPAQITAARARLRAG